MPELTEQIVAQPMVEGEAKRKVPWRTLIANNQWLLLVFMTVVMAVVTGILNPNFWRADNLSSLFQQITVLGLVATGATILIISGNFDISVDSYVGLSCCVMPMMINHGWPTPIAVVGGILICVACSTFNGVASIVFSAPSFIISLATLTAYEGISLQITNGVIQNSFGHFVDLTDVNVFSVIPLIFLITVVGYVAMHCLLKYTLVGRHVYAIGDNRDAAYRAGIKVKKNLVIFFAINGLLCGVAAWLLLARVGGGLPTTGQGLALQGIGAVVIGGAPITGGKGSVVGTFCGVLLLGTIANALNVLNVSPYYQQIAVGSLIIVAVAFTALRLRLGATR